MVNSKNVIINDTKSAVIKLVTLGLAVLFAWIGFSRQVFGMTSPLVVAVAVLFGQYIYIFGAVSVVCFFISSNQSDFCYVLSCTLLLCIVAGYVGFKKKEKLSSVTVMLCVFVVMTICNLCMWALAGAKGEMCILRLMFTFINSALVYMGLKVKQKYFRDKIITLSGSVGIYSCVMFVLFISLLGGMDFRVNIGRIVGGIVTLVMAGKFKNAGGAVTGVLVAVAMVIAKPSLLAGTLVMCVGGLIAGSFVSSFFISLAYLVSSVVVLALTYQDNYTMLVDIIISSVVYVLIPQSLIKKFTDKMSFTNSSSEYSSLLLYSKMSVASQAIQNIYTQLQRVSSTVENKNNCSQDFPAQLFNSCCADCPNVQNCLDQYGNRMTDCFNAIHKVLRQGREVNSVMLGTIIPFCTYGERMKKQSYNLFEQIIYTDNSLNRSKQLRHFLCGQLDITCDLLDDMCKCIQGYTNVDRIYSQKIINIFNDSGISGTSGCVFTDKTDIVRVEVYVPNQQLPDLVRLTAKIGMALDCELDLPIVSKGQEMIKLSFVPATEYCLEAYVYSAAGTGEQSGDNFEIVTADSGERLMCLSDGMGTGRRAQLDSLFALNVFTNLLGSGFSPITSIKMLNSVLRVKGWSESFATIDCARINLRKPFVQFVKAGAASGYIIHKESVIAVDSDSFPPGILDEVIPDVKTLDLCDGDIVVMTSDGVDTSTVMEFAGKICGQDLSVNQMAKMLGELAFDAQKRDDITAVVARISKL